jgi:hypothetical protein
MRFAILLLLCGCGLYEDPCKLDGQVIQDRDGKFYKVQAGLGKTYFMQPHEPVSSEDFLKKNP